jgi:hypothetical protein
MLRHLWLRTQRAKGLRIGRVIDVNLFTVPDHSLAQAWKIGDFDLPVFTAHQVHEIFIEWILQMMRHRRPWKGHEIAGTDFDFFAVDLGHAAARENVKPRFFMLVEMVDAGAGLDVDENLRCR